MYDGRTLLDNEVIKKIFNTKIAHSIMILVKNVTGQVSNSTIVNNTIEQ